MTSERQKFKLSVLSLWVGILIPILVAIIPIAIKYVIPEHKLEYAVVGPIQVDETSAIQIEITNRGEKAEKNVRVWIRVDAYTLGTEKAGDAPKGPPPIQVSSSGRHTLTREGEYHVISVGDLRPSESVTLSLLLRGIHLVGSLRTASKWFSIKSDDRVARITGPGEDSFATFAYPFGFWMFIVLMLLMGVYALYYEYLMPPEKKEKLILEQIDKLKRVK